MYPEVPPKVEYTLTERGRSLVRALDGLCDWGSKERSVQMKHEVIKQAFYKTLPVMAGYIVLGIGFGILLRNAGYGTAWAFAMGVFIYAGSMQYVGVSLLTGGASVLTTILTTVMVNARHLIYSISMIEPYKDTGKYKPYLIFALTDETYSMSAAGKRRIKKRRLNTGS